MIIIIVIGPSPSWRASWCSRGWSGKGFACSTGGSAVADSLDVCSTLTINNYISFATWTQLRLISRYRLPPINTKPHKNSVNIFVEGLLGCTLWSPCPFATSGIHQDGCHTLQEPMGWGDFHAAYEMTFIGYEWLGTQIHHMWPGMLGPPHCWHSCTIRKYVIRNTRIRHIWYQKRISVQNALKLSGNIAYTPNITTC